MIGPRNLDPRPSACTPDSFVQHFGHVYEKSPWVCQPLLPLLSSGTLDTSEALHSAMEQVVEKASDQTKLELLRDHPELGSRSAIFGNLEVASKREQSSLGLTNPKNVHLKRLQANNAAYRERFGFPFIVAITGFTVADVLRTFDMRIKNRPDQEFRTALNQVHKIARIRLNQMIETGEAQVE